MQQIAPSTPQVGDSARQLARENLAGTVWMVLLIGAGCFVLDGFAESARRKGCLMRGAALCDHIKTRAGQWHRQTLVAEQHIGMATYLKGSRDW
jgi:hypothetical protein